MTNRTELIYYMTNVGDSLRYLRYNLPKKKIDDKWYIDSDILSKCLHQLPYTASNKQAIISMIKRVEQEQENKK